METTCQRAAGWKRYPAARRSCSGCCCGSRRGGGHFPFGSRLWTLGQLKAAERQAAAEQYVAEALAEETGLTVDSVTLTQSGGECAALTVQLTAGDTALTAEVALR